MCAVYGPIRVCLRAQMTARCSAALALPGTRAGRFTSSRGRIALCLFPQPVNATWRLEAHCATVCSRACGVAEAAHPLCARDSRASKSTVPGRSGTARSCSSSVSCRHARCDADTMNAQPQLRTASRERLTKATADGPFTPSTPQNGNASNAGLTHAHRCTVFAGNHDMRYALPVRPAPRRSAADASRPGIRSDLKFSSS